MFSKNDEVYNKTKDLYFDLLGTDVVFGHCVWLYWEETKSTCDICLFY